MRTVLSENPEDMRTSFTLTHANQQHMILDIGDRAFDTLCYECPGAGVSRILATRLWTLSGTDT